MIEPHGLHCKGPKGKTNVFGVDLGAIKMQAVLELCAEETDLQLINNQKISYV
jgi:hypothetical protein